MTTRAIRRLRQPSVLRPTSSKAPAEVKNTYKVWCGLITQYRAWVFESQKKKTPLDQPLVCIEWVASFDKFFHDMGARPEGMCIKRVNPSEPYSPANCFWGRPSKPGARPRILITHNGQTRTIPEWAEALGVDASVLYGRRNRGYSSEAILQVTPQGVR